MNRPTEAQIKEFWEWCGIRYEPDEDEFKVIFPDSQPWYNFGHDWKMDEIEPPVDLNNLFKYAVPKVLNLTGIDFAGSNEDFDSWICRVWYGIWTNRGSVQVKQDYYEAEGKDPALALFWAIREVIWK